MRTAARPVAVAALIVTVQALLVAFFAWPAIRTAPRDVPVVVAGPAPMASAFADRLAAGRPGAFSVRIVADAAAADAALRDREAYAAFVVSPATSPSAPSIELRTSSAASPTLAQLLTQQVQALSAGAPVKVVDVVPADPDDPRGAGLAAAILPLLLTSMIGGVLLLVVALSWWARLTGVVAFGALAGLVVGAVLQYGYGAVPGSYLVNAAVIGLTATAIAATVAGLGALLGRAGVALGVVLVFLVGNPLSGIVSAPELLPQPWGAIGQLLPPGAGVTLLRSVAFFDGAGGGAAAWVLATWAAVGLALLVVGRQRLFGPEPRDLAVAHGANASDVRVSA